MTRRYEAPALEVYGTLEVLTGSTKCTPGDDFQGAATNSSMYWDGQAWKDSQSGDILDPQPDRDKCWPTGGY